jgi:hypothetical protein
MGKLSDNIKTLSIPALKYWGRGGVENWGSDDMSDGEFVQDDGHYTQWSIISGNKYSPTIPTTEKLAPGFYDPIYIPDVGICLEKKKVNTDELFILPSPELDEIISDITKFWERRDVYKKYGLLHKRGILMYGKPGVGKSATIQLCTQYLIDKLGGVVVNVANMDQLEHYSSIIWKLRQIEPERPIIVIFEDIESIAGENAYTASMLLNILDGVKQIDNVVYLATTNYPEKLQDRITNRPSRFDRRYEVLEPNSEIREAYFRNKLSNDDLQNIDMTQWVKRTDGMSLAHLRELVISVIVMGNEFDETIDRLNGLKVKPRIKSDVGSIGFGNNK